MSKSRSSALKRDREQRRNEKNAEKVRRREERKRTEGEAPEVLENDADSEPSSDQQPAVEPGTGGTGSSGL